MNETFATLHKVLIMAVGDIRCALFSLRLTSQQVYDLWYLTIDEID